MAGYGNPGLPADPEDRGEIHAGRMESEASEKTLYYSPDDKREFPQSGEGVNMRKRLAMGQAVDVGQPQKPITPVKGGRTVSNGREYGGRG